MSKPNWGYEFKCLVSQYGSSGVRADYHVNVGILEDSFHKGIAELYFRRHATLHFVSFANAEYDQYSGQTLHPAVLPSYYVEFDKQARLTSAEMIQRFFGSTQEPKLEMQALSYYGGGVETLKFLGKVFEYGNSAAVSNHVAKLDNDDTNLWYSYDPLARFLFNLHGCGARSVAQATSEEWRARVQAAQFTPANVRGFAFETKRWQAELWERQLQAASDAGVLAHANA